MFLLEEESLPGIEVQPEFKVSPIFDFGDVGIEAWQMILFLLGVIAVIAIPIAIYSLIRARKGEKFAFTTKDLVYGSICLAMSYVLSFFGIGLNLGGTITFASILPVSIYCYYFGFRKGAIVCVVFMLLQLTQGPFIVTPWSMLLDYLIPYFALSLAGAFAYNPKKHRAANGSKRFALVSHRGYYIGMLLYVLIRYASHIMSGIVFWDLWYGPAPAGFIVGYSMGYNSYCLIDWAIAVAASLALLSSKTFDKLMLDVSALSRTKRKAAVTAASGEQGADGSVTAETDGLAHTDPGTEDHK